MKQLAVIIDWYGPYKNTEEVQEHAEYYADGLYMGIGKIKYQKGKSRLQYIGITKELSRRVSNKHNKLMKITQSPQIWLGEVASINIPGRKTQYTDKRLSLSEWGHIYFLQLPLNDVKKTHPPSEPVTIINRWWNKNNDAKRNRRPHVGWPDIIDYMGREYGAKIAWLGRKSGGRCSVWGSEDF